MPPRVNCRDCKYYYITFDERAPYGCRAYGFKSPNLPSMAVYQSSGNICQLFSSKTAKKPSSGKSSSGNGGGFYA